MIFDMFWMWRMVTKSLSPYMARTGIMSVSTIANPS